MRISKFPKKTRTCDYRSQTPCRGACRALPAWPGTLAVSGWRLGSGTAVSWRTVPASPGSRQQTQPSAAPRRVAGKKRHPAERGEPRARNLQKQKVCNLAAVFHTPYPSCLRSRTSRFAATEPHAVRSPCKRHKRRTRGQRSLRLGSRMAPEAEDAAGPSPALGHKERRGLESRRRRAKKRLSSNFALRAAENLPAGPPVRRSHTHNF